jgi:hypothetical protein
MSKAQQSQTYNNAQNQQTLNNANEATANTTLQGALGTAQGNAASMLPGIMSGYSDIAGTGGGINQTSNDTYSSLAGGLDSAKSLAANGGISPASIQAMEDQASQAAQSTYATGAAQEARTAAATGGYGNTAALQAQNQRQSGQAAAQATTNELASITGMQQAGEEAGTSLLGSEMSTGAGGLAQQQQNQTANKLAAVGGEANVYGMNVQQATATVSQILQNYQQTGQLNNQDMSIMANIAEQPGIFSQVISGLGSLGGLAGSLMTGISSLRDSGGGDDDTADSQSTSDYDAG